MSRQLDTEKALDLYRQGQERLGVHAKTVAYMSVMSTRPSEIMRDPERFTRELHAQLADLRGRSRSLAVALYQLLRLIWTGRVLDDGYGTRWSRGDLWDQLYEGAGLEKPQRGGVPAEVDNDPGPWTGGDDFDRDTTRDLVTIVVTEKIKQAQRDPQRKSADADALTLESLDELDGLLEEIATSVQGPVQKLIADGGREAIVTSAQQDRRALRWMRVPSSGTACGFCLMVASRGAVYASEKSGGGIKGGEFHPNCQCVTAPIFSNKYQDPDAVKQAKKLWKDSKAASVQDFNRYIDTLRKGERT